MTKVTCPVCGSSDVKREAQAQTEQLTLGPEFSFEQVNYTCKTCGEEGDFENINDPKYLAAYKDAQTVAIKNLIENLAAQSKISMAFFERAFELPVRTVTRWKNGDFSATAVALLRTATTYPWIVEVADNKFDAVFAKQVLLGEGLGLLKDVVGSMKDSSVQFSVEHDDSSVLATAILKMKKPLLTKLGDPKLVGKSFPTGNSAVVVGD